MLPNWFHIGAGKCKSTWLYRVCLEHPDIYVPGNHYDNVNFFVNSYHRGLDWYEETFFADHAGEPVVGEFSNSYMAFEPALQRMARHAPDAKLTMTIMNPVHRIFYGWAHRHLKKKCAVTLFGERRRVSAMEIQELLYRCGLDPSRGLFDMPDRLVHHHGHSWFRQMADSSFYAFCIERIHRYFDADRLLVMLYDDLLDDRAAWLRRFFEFLGVDAGFETSLAPEDANPDPPLVEAEQWFPLELRKELTEMFREDILALQEMLDRDLSAWLDAETLPEYAARPR